MLFNVMFTTVRRTLSSRRIENIGKTGIAKNPDAGKELLSAYTSFMTRLRMSTLPEAHPYRATMEDYLKSSINLLQSEKQTELVSNTGLELEELLEECQLERDLMEGIEDDHRCE